MGSCIDLAESVPGHVLFFIMRSRLESCLARLVQEVEALEILPI